MVMSGFLRFCYEGQHAEGTTVSVFWSVAQVGDPLTIKEDQLAYTSEALYEYDLENYKRTATEVIVMLKEIRLQLHAAVPTTRRFCSAL
jgi:hypothetical protein